MYRLSICMMVKNEEKNLNISLDSIKPLLEDSSVELIIVDTGSSDKTVEIAKKYTNKVYFHPWNNDFSEMRNISISYAKGQWVFIVDADEEIENVNELKKILNSNIFEKNNTIVVQVKSLSTLNDKNKTAYNPSPRIFRNDGEFKYIGVVHNQPIYKKPIYSSEVSLIHSGYVVDDKELMNRKFIRTKTILESELKKDPNNIYYQFQLGVSYDMHGDYLEALSEFRKAYNLLKKQTIDEKYNRAYVYGAFSRSAYANHRYIEAINICTEGLNIRKDYIDLYFILAMSNNNIGNIEEAKIGFLKYLDLMDRFNNLSITKDLSIILYNADKESVDICRYILTNLYIKEKDYRNAYKNASLIINKINKNVVMSKVLLNIDDISKYKNYFNEIQGDEILKNNFCNNMEDEIEKINLEQQNEVYKKLSKIKDDYGNYCSIKILKDNEVLLALKNFLDTFDFKDKPIFYSQVFKELFNDTRILFNYFKKIDSYTLRNIIKYLLSKYKKSEEIFIEFLLNTEIRSNDITSNKVYISIAFTLLTNKCEEKKEVDNTSYEIFKKYIISGTNYVSELYKIEKSRIIYKDVSNYEDRFFILMYLVREYTLKGDLKIIIKYFKEAINCNKDLIKYMEKYKEEILILFDKGEGHV